MGTSIDGERDVGVGGVGEGVDHYVRNIIHTWKSKNRGGIVRLTRLAKDEATEMCVQVRSGDGR